MGSVFSESVEAYSESDLRDAAHRLRFRANGCPLNMEEIINDEVESLLRAKRIKPTYAQRRDIDIAVAEHDIVNIRAAAESAGLDFHAVCQIEKRALLGMLSRAMNHEIDAIDVKLLERRLRGSLGGDGLVESADEAWGRVREKLKIYGPRLKATTSRRPIPESARKPGPEITPPVCKISPAVWVALEKKLGVFCNPSLWPDTTRLLFLTDLDSIAFDDEDAPPVASTRATAHTAPPSQTRAPASGSIVAKDITVADFAGHAAPQVPCKFCGSMWPSTGHCARHRAYCRKNPDSPSFLCEGTTNDGGHQERCAYCGTGFADARRCAIHEAHCFLNLRGPPPPRPSDTTGLKPSRRPLAEISSGQSDSSSCCTASVNPQSPKEVSHTKPQLFPCQHCGLTFGSRRSRGSHKAHCPKNPRSRAHRASLETSEAPPNADAEHQVSRKRRQCHVALAAAALGLLDLTHQGEATRERQRAAVVHAMWDMRVIRAWSSVDWGESSQEILCFLLWRNIDFAVKGNYVSEQAIQCFLGHFGAPEEYRFRAAMWDSVLDLLFKQAPDVIEQKLQTFLKCDIPTRRPRFLLL